MSDWLVSRPQLSVTPAVAARRSGVGGLNSTSRDRAVPGAVDCSTPRVVRACWVGTGRGRAAGRRARRCETPRARRRALETSFRPTPELFGSGRGEASPAPSWLRFDNHSVAIISVRVVCARAVVPLFKVAKRGPRAWVAPLSVSPAFLFHDLRPRADVHRKVFFRHIRHCDSPRLVCLRRAPRESHLRYSSKTAQHSSFH